MKDKELWNILLSVKQKRISCVEAEKKILNLFDVVCLSVLSDEEILSKACSMFLLGKMTPSNEIIDKRYIWIKACKWMQKQIKNK